MNNFVQDSQVSEEEMGGPAIYLPLDICSAAAAWVRYSAVHSVSYCI